MTVQVALRCRAENQTIGTVSGQPGERISARTLRRNFEATPGYAFAPGAVRDEVQLLCPRCKNAVTIDAGDEDVAVVPNTLRFGAGEVPHDGA